MATQTERTVVYEAGVVQAIALVTFPAASTALTDPAEYDLSSTQYGTLFLPQVVTAITAALLPLTISFGQEELTAFSAAVAGGIIAFYQLGYGIAAFGVGPVVDGGVDLSTVYALAAVVAAGMGLWSFLVAGRRPSPAALHPHLGHPA
jgi:hypothetical protein